MRSVFRVLLAISLALPSVPAAAQGPIERSIAVYAQRIADEGLTTSVGGKAAVELRWQELGPVIAGHRVTAILSDGSRVTGDAVVVRDEALVLDVKGSRGSSRYTGSNAPLPRTAIAFVELEKQGGAGRPLGIVLGVLAGVVIGGWLTDETTDSAGTGIPLFLGVASGITLTGYYVGKNLSREVTLIKVVP